MSAIANKFSKSQIAIQYSFDVRQAHPNTYVFWAHGGTKERFEESFRDIADALQLPGRHDSDTDILRLIHDWLRSENNGPWLIILDNADDASVFFSGLISDTESANASRRQPLNSYLPQSRNGKILITSRSRDAAAKLTGDYRHILNIPPMAEAQADELLRNKLGEKYDADVAADLLRALEYIPLAITQAASYIHQRAPLMSPSVYLADFQASSESKASLLDKHMGDLRRDPSTANSIVTSWHITLEHIRRNRRSAADLLSFMSYFHPQRIPGRILRSYHRGKRGSNVADAELGDDLDTLRDFSLISVTANNDEYELHPLVQFCTRAQLESRSDTTWSNVFLQIMSREYPSGIIGTWRECQELNPHLEAALNARPRGIDDSIYLARLLTNTAVYLMDATGNYAEAEQRCKRALHYQQGLLGPGHDDTVWTVKQLARSLGWNGRWEEAGEWQRLCVFDDQRTTLGSLSPSRLQIASDLVHTLVLQDKLDEAEQLSKQVLERSDKIPGEGSAIALGTYAYLAEILLKQEKLEEAERLYRRVYGEWVGLYGQESEHAALSARRLGVVLLRMARFDEASKLLQCAYEDQKRLFGEEHVETLLTARIVGEVFLNQQRFDKAEKLLRHAYQGLERRLGKAHYNTVASAFSVGRALVHLGKFEDAEHWCRQSYEGMDKIYGAEHLNTLVSLVALADATRGLGLLEEAVELYQKAWTGYEKVKGPEFGGTVYCKDRYFEMRAELGSIDVVMGDILVR